MLSRAITKVSLVREYADEFFLRGLFFSLRFFDEPEISDSGPTT